MNFYAIALGINLVDILMAITLGCILRFTNKDGIVAELFKLFGVCCMVFITLHYYVRLAHFLKANFFAKDAVTEIFAFCLLGFSIFFTFVVITKGWDLILKIKSFDVIDRWGRLILTLIRSCLICSMIFLSLLMAGNNTLSGQAKRSFSWFVFRKPAVELYRATYKSLVKKIFPDELINKKVISLIEDKPSRQGDDT